jgi:putative endonuclease
MIWCDVCTSTARGLVEGFTRKHGVKTLVHFEEHGTVPLAIQREKALKHWLRKWKLDLIERANPEWRDLWEDISRL